MLRRAGRTAAGLGLAIGLATGLAARGALARAFDPTGPQWDGCGDLVRLARSELGAARVLTPARLDWGELRADDALLVLHPERTLGAASLGSFLAAGGRLALLDDYGAGDRVLARWGIEREAAPARPARSLRHNPALAIARPAEDPDAASGAVVHPVVAEVEQLVTNHATTLRHPKLAPVLVIPTETEGDAVLAVAGVVGQGRVFAMGDPSAVTNQMLRYPGNRAFASGLVRYLVDDPAGRAGGRLFVLAGDFDEAGSFAGAGLRGEAERFAEPFVALVANIRRDGLPGPLAVGLAALAAMGVAAWITSVAGRTYRAPRPGFVRGAALASQAGAGARAAVLGAEGTDPALAWLDLARAMEEELALRLGLPEGAPRASVVAAAGSVLDGAELSALKEVVTEMARVEADVVSGRSTPMSDRHLEETLARVERVVAAARVAAARGGGA
jgi:hypothetical protein